MRSDGDHVGVRGKVASRKLESGYTRALRTLDQRKSNLTARETQAYLSLLLVQYRIDVCCSAFDYVFHANESSVDEYLREGYAGLVPLKYVSVPL